MVTIPVTTYSPLPRKWWQLEGRLEAVTYTVTVDKKGHLSCSCGKPQCIHMHTARKLLPDA